MPQTETRIRRTPPGLTRALLPLASLLLFAACSTEPAASNAPRVQRDTRAEINNTPPTEWEQNAAKDVQRRVGGEVLVRVFEGRCMLRGREPECSCPKVVLTPAPKSAAKPDIFALTAAAQGASSELSCAEVCLSADTGNVCQGGGQMRPKAAKRPDVAAR